MFWSDVCRFRWLWESSLKKNAFSSIALHQSAFLFASFHSILIWSMFWATPHIDLMQKKKGESMNTNSKKKLLNFSNSRFLFSAMNILFGVCTWVFNVADRHRHNHSLCVSVFACAKRKKTYRKSIQHYIGFMCGTRRLSAHARLYNTQSTQHFHRSFSS